MRTIFNVIVVLTRGATNVFAVPVWGGIWAAIVSLTQEETVLAGFSTGWVRGFQWSFHTTGGRIVAGCFGLLGIIHGIRVTSAGSNRGLLGFLGFILDNSWSLPNSVIGSVWATITLGIGIDKENSRGTGRLVLEKGVFSGYDTTYGSVIAGNGVLRHETVHVAQAWVSGPFFYPIFVTNYAVT